MKKHNDHEFDDLVDPDWEPSPEDFVLVEQNEEEIIEEKNRKNKRVKMIASVIAVMLVFQVVAVFFSTFSIDAIRFLKISYQLSQQDDIQNYKRSVVTVQGDDSRGTGFSISSDGLIVTNHHVIEDEERIMVGFYKGKLFEAEVISSYPDVDIAFLKVDGTGLPFLPISEENGIVSEDIYVIGNPLSWTQIANKGEILDINELTIISAPIYRGNSGSPVINMDGEVVAVVFAKRRTTEYGSKSVGLAVPIETVIEHLP